MVSHSLIKKILLRRFDKDKLSKDVATKQARKLKKKLSRFQDKNVAPKRGAKEVRRTDQETPTIHWNV